MRSGLRYSIGALLMVCAFITLAWVAGHLLVADSTRREYAATLENTPPPPPKATAPVTLRTGEPIGTLTIPRLGLSGVVVEGDSDKVLDAAIGHLPDTPLPWHGGNSALAAHRDEIFRPLKDVKIGDVLKLETPHGTFEYRVRKTAIVMPQDVAVLDPGFIPVLTLISCYPFNYVGNAPKRFIVTAERVDRSAQS